MDRRSFLLGATAFGLTSLVRPVGAATAPLQLNFYQDWAPFSAGRDRTVSGLLIDVLHEALHNRMGIEVEYHGLPWKRAQVMVERGLADGFCTTPNDRRRSYTFVSKVPVVISKKKIYVSPTHPRLAELKKIKSLDDLGSYTFSAVLGGGWEQANLDKRRFDILYKPTLDECLSLVALKRRDIFIADQFIIAPAIRKHGLTDKVIQLPLTVDEVTYNLCIGKKSPYHTILAQFDKVLNDMKADGTHQKIIDKYL